MTMETAMIAIEAKTGTAEPGRLRAAFEATGSPRWIMHTISQFGLDAKHGFRLDVDFTDDVVKGALQSTEAALAAGAVDLIDTDWLSIARARSEGMKIAAAFPYGRIMGAIVVPRDSAIGGLGDLRGKRIGVVRRADKNWIVTRAVCLRRHGFDVQAEASLHESLSKTALVGDLESGRVDAALLFWHLIPRLTASHRYRQVVDVLDLLPDLGVGRIPTTFFAFRDAFIAANPGLVRAFAAAFREAVALMRARDDVWAEISRTFLGAGAAAFLPALREKWDSRIATTWATTWNAAVIGDLHRLFDVIRRDGGAGSIGCETIPEGTFSSVCLPRVAAGPGRAGTERRAEPRAERRAEGRAEGRKADMAACGRDGYGNG